MVAKEKTFFAHINAWLFEDAAAFKASNEENLRLPLKVKKKRVSSEDVILRAVLSLIRVLFSFVKGDRYVDIFPFWIQWCKVQSVLGVFVFCKQAFVQLKLVRAFVLHEVVCFFLVI